MTHSIKYETRKNIKTIVNSLSAQEQQRQSEAVCSKLINKLKCFTSKKVLIFMPLSDEIDLTGCTKYLLENNYDVYVPVSFEKSIMAFYKIDSLSEVIKGKYGICEPIKRIKYEFSSDDIIIVPGVGFDKRCNRLGRGKGYYDIFLAQNNLYSIGVAYNEQIVDKICTETHDISLDEVITAGFDFKKELT